jgi:uncharacterized protein
MNRNVEAVQAIYAAFAKGDVPTILSHLREDVVWEHDALDHGIPWLTPRRGRASVTQFFESLAALDIQKFEPVDLLASETRVVGIIWGELVVRKTGKVIKDLELHVWTFDAQGKVSQFRHVVDTLQHMQALKG